MFIKNLAHLLLILGLFTPLFILSTTLYAQDPTPGLPNPLPGDPTDPDPPPQEDTFAMAYAADQDISTAEARRRLDIMLEMPALVKEIEANEPEYAAAWIVHRPNLELVVSFTTPDGAEKLKKYLEGIEWADIVRAEQSARSHEDLRAAQNILLDAATARPDLAFESGVFFPAGKVHVFTPTVDAVAEFMASIPALREHLAFIEVFYQEVLETGDSYSPEMPGGTHLTTCTAGFVFKNNSTGKRYISTTGHCGNNQSSISTNLGSVEYEHTFWHDFQAHDVFKARGSGLTNNVMLGSQMKTVIALENIVSLSGGYVCKYGKSSGTSCGYVTSTSHDPGQDAGNTYLKIEPSSPIAYLACGGDSGGPVYKTLTGGELVAVGLVRGAPAGPCSDVKSYFSATPLDYIDSIGHYSVITGPYPPHFYQNVFAANGSCTEYTGDVNPNGTFSNWDSGPCPTSAPGSGTATSYTNWVARNKLHEAIWRGGYGYIRDVPLNNNGTVNWGSAPNWQQCCSGLSVGGQGAYIAGDSFYQNVFQPDGACNAYSASLDNNGNFTPWDYSGACSTYAPGTGSVTSYTNWVFGNKLYEAIWRNGYGYIRNVPINDNGTVNWGAAPTWDQCCSGLSVGGQGAYILWHQ